MSETKYKSKKLAILGASYLQLPVILKAKEMGIETHVFAIPEGAIAKDECHKFYPISTTDKNKILAICKELEIDGILTIASDIAVPTVNFVAYKLGLVGNPHDNLLITTDKHAMKDALKTAGISTPRFHLVKPNDETPLQLNFNFPVIVKPTDRSGSIGVEIIKEPKNLNNAIIRSKSVSLNGRVIVEEYIDSIEVSVESISFKGSHEIIVITDKVTNGPPHFVEIEHHQPSLLSEKIQGEIKKTTLKALDVLGIVNGASHTEFLILRNGDILLNELGARMGGDFIGSDLVQLSTGYDYLKAVIQVSLGSPPTASKSQNIFAGVVYKTKSNFKSFEQALSCNADIVSYRFSDDIPNDFRKSSDRFDYFIYKSGNKISLIN